MVIGKHQIDFEGAKIAYSDSGSGEAVVLLHCTASSSRQWRGFTETYGQDFRVIAIDLFGHGESDTWPGHRPLTLADEAKAVSLVLDRIGEPVHLIGHSYGGAVALQVALEEARRIRSLTVIEPVAFYLLRGGHASEMRYFLEINAVASDISTAAMSGNFASGMERFVDYWGGRGAWKALPEEKRRDLVRAIGTVALNFWSTTTESTRRDAFRSLDLPTLVMEGSGSGPVTRRICELLRAELPNCRGAVIEAAGHMSPLTDPAAVNALIVQHISEGNRLARPRCRSAA
jgi:pimeloyl-ACP methyl ester carboxylesterase